MERGAIAASAPLPFQGFIAGLKALRSHRKTTTKTFCGAPSEALGVARYSDTNKGEIQGSLHCATDDKTVRCFGRDDVRFGWVGENRQRQRQIRSSVGVSGWRLCPGRGCLP